MIDKINDSDWTRDSGQAAQPILSRVNQIPLLITWNKDRLMNAPPPKTYQEFKENKSQQFTGKATQWTKQANFGAVSTAATAKDEEVIDFGGGALAIEEGSSDTTKTGQPEDNNGFIDTATTAATALQGLTKAEWMQRRSLACS
ncbi:uncharacterized protein N7515_007067 [Penicillium bovifimosum]|uniref:Uncharacterized protein n=1 Tax=Penicillium bovifimosum TaxID=126998 RepID=A0A9W9L0B7_9EURO|nr:uncharacterized protein N7515_007067 [Penicillium bovifimosum]KAJ5131028.1 hypothetical protein N7515_007067 [Penicillium bovifimosum]